MKTTFRSKILMAAALAAFGFAGLANATSQPATAPAAPQTYSAEKLALAKNYIATVPVKDDIKAAVEEMSQHVAPEQRVLFRSLADKTIDYNRLTTAGELATAELFTEDEIKAMTKFFSSPEGMSIRKKMPAYEARMQPVITEVLQAFALKLQENNVSVNLTDVPTTP